MWDERYAEPGFAYGVTPNDFLREQLEQLPSGTVLDVAGGEGRNAVFLAERGFDVLVVDGSAVGLKKAQALAAERGVSLRTELTDLASYHPAPASLDGVVSIWAHVPPPVRKELHRALVDALRPGGVLILEAYTPDQVELKTGGPPVPQMCMTLAELREELAGLDVVIGQECRRMVSEGAYHEGLSAVVQVVARKPT